MFVFPCVHVSFLSMCFSRVSILSHLCSCSWLLVCPVFMFVFPTVCVSFYKYKCLCSVFMLICPVYMFVFACSVFVFMVVVNLSCIHVCFSLCSC